MSGKENVSDDSSEAKLAPKASNDSAALVEDNQAKRDSPRENLSSLSKQPSPLLVLRSIDLGAVKASARDANEMYEFTFPRPKSADAKLQSTNSAAGAPTPRFRIPHQRMSRSSADQSKPPDQNSHKARPKAKPIPSFNLRQSADPFRPKASSLPKAFVPTSQQTKCWPSTVYKSNYTHPSNAYHSPYSNPAYNITNHTSDAYPHQQKEDSVKSSGYMRACYPSMENPWWQNQYPTYHSGYGWASYPTLAHSQHQKRDPRYHSDYNWAGMQSAYPEQQSQSTYCGTEPYWQSSTATPQCSSYPYHQQNVYPYYQNYANIYNQYVQPACAPHFQNGVGYYPYYCCTAHQLPAYAYHGYPDGMAYTPQTSQAWSCDATSSQGCHCNPGYNPICSGFQVQLTQSFIRVAWAVRHTKLAVS